MRSSVHLEVQFESLAKACSGAVLAVGRERESRDETVNVNSRRDLQVSSHGTRFNLSDCADIDSGTLATSTLAALLCRQPPGTMTSTRVLQRSVAILLPEIGGEGGDRGSSSKVEVE